MESTTTSETVNTTVETEDAAPAKEEFAINSDMRLSQCEVWRMLEQVYQFGGKGLWEQVPYYVTSSTFLAGTYAELIVSFLFDHYKSLNKKEPIYIVEMGTGTGCLSFYLMKELARKRALFPHLEELKLKYVMCDFSTNTINDWLNNKELKQFRDNGTLEFAIFKPEEQTEIVTYDGTHIGPSTVKNPIIAIANYFFDSLKHDAFRVKDHQIEETLHTFYFEDANGAENTSSPFEGLRKRESYAPVSDKYYDDPVLDKVLQSYGPQYENATFLFPLGAFNCLDNLRTMSNNQLVLLSTDKGYTQADFMQGLWEQPFVAHHGIFSYSVNYDAIAKYFNVLGGFSYASNALSFSVETQMSLLLDGTKSEDMTQTRYHFLENVARRNDINYLYYCQNLLLTAGTCSKNDMVRTYISLIRTSNCDPIALYMCGEMIAAAVGEVGNDLRRHLMAVLDEVEANFYHVRQRTDALYYSGKIRYMIDDFEGCVKAVTRSISEFGENSHSLYYLAACNEVKKDFAAALDLYKRSLAIDPNCEVTKKAVERMQSKLSTVS
jgi:hypothetical protein